MKSPANNSIRYKEREHMFPFFFQPEESKPVYPYPFYENIRHIKMGNGNPPIPE